MKIVKVLLGLSLMIILMVSSNCYKVSAQTNGPSDIANFIDQVMEKQMEEETIPNATVSVVYKGEVIFQKGYGYADMEAKLPVNPETSLFRIGSISKLFTGTAIMQLVEQDKLDLDADINEYLDFDIPNEFVDQARVQPDQAITLRHLLTHTPGFEDYSDTIFRLSEEELLSLEAYVKKHLPKRVFPAGEIVAYSNYGTTLAGYIVERVSGMPFSNYIDEFIFHPLQMEHSTFEQPPVHFSKQMVKPYRYVDGAFGEASFEFVPGPAGAMSSSAVDMAHFMQAFLQDGHFEKSTILEEETVQEMFSQQFSQHPSLEGMTLGFIEGTFNGERTLFHGGSTMLFNSALYLLPEEELGVFLSYSGGSHFVHNAVFQQVMDELFPIGKQSQLSSLDGSKERAEKYIGEYNQNRKSFTTSEKISSLMMGIIHVNTNENGNLAVTHAGETNQFVEIEPGMYESMRVGRTPDPFGDFRTIIFETDANGKTMLMADGPMTYAKAPWYATSSFTFLTVAIIVLLIIGTVIYWGIVGVIRLMLKKKMVYSKEARLAKWMAILFGLLTICLLIGIGTSGSIDPIYQLPKVAYGALPLWSPVLDFIPYMMVLFSLILFVLTIVMWWKKTGKIFARIHYTLFLAGSMFFVWLFSYWHLI